MLLSSLCSSGTINFCRITSGGHRRNVFTSSRNRFRLFLRKLISIHLANGEYITNEKSEVILTATTKGTLKGMIITGMKPKNSIWKYSKGRLKNLSNTRWKMVPIMSILRQLQKIRGSWKKMTNGRLMDRKDTQCNLSNDSGLRLSLMISLGRPSSTISSQYGSTKCSSNADYEMIVLDVWDVTLMKL
jgi:hypothetical protein